MNNEAPTSAAIVDGGTALPDQQSTGQQQAGTTTGAAAPYTPAIPLINEVSFSGQEAVAAVKTTGRFKIHGVVVSSFSAFSFILWTFMGFGVGWFPWFIFPIALGAMTMTTHFYLFLRPREWLQLHICWWAILNVTLFVSWEGSTCFSPFFVYGLFALTWLLGVHIIVTKFRNPENKLWLFYIHVLSYITINLITFFIYLDTRDDDDDDVFMWWVIPGFLLGAIVTLHYCIAYKLDRFMLHVYMFVVCQLEIFSIWVVCGTDIFPWFIGPFIVWGVLLFVHYYVKFVKAGHTSAAAPAAAPQPDPEAQLGQQQQQFVQQPTVVVPDAYGQQYGVQPVYVIAGGAQNVPMMYPPVTVPQPDPNTP